MKKTKTKEPTAPKKLADEIKQFEKANPSIAEAMRILDVSMIQYETALRSLEPTKTYTNSNTKVL